MSTDPSSYLRTLTIGKGMDDWATYVAERHEALEPGTDLDVALQFAAKNAAPAPKAQSLAVANKRPERRLDIREAGNGASLILVFHIGPAIRDRLQFSREEPIFFLPLNAGGEEQGFIKASGLLDQNGWSAYLVCDLEKIRGSALAERIRNHNKGATSHGPPNLLNIPFALNVVDPLFEAAPWVVPGHEPDEDCDKHHHRHPVEEHHRHIPLPPMTHGGVHPSAASFLEVDLGP